MKMRLLTRLLLFILLPVCAGFVVLATVSDYLAAQGMRKQIDEDLSIMVNVQARELDNVITVLQSTTVNLATNAHTIDYLNALQKNDPNLPATTTEAGETLKELTTNYTRIKHAAVLSSDGIIAQHTAKERQGTTVTQLPYFTTAMRGETTVHTLYNEKNNGFDVIISSPVKMQGKIIGAALVEVDIEQLAAATTDNMKIAKTGFCFFYTKEGRLISHADKGLVGQDHSTLGWLQEIMRSIKGKLDYNWQGMTKVAYYDRVPSTNWIVVLGVEEADLLTPITEMSRTTAIMSGFIILIVGLIVFLIARNMASVLRGCANLAQFVAAGNFKLTPAYQSQLVRDSARTDEIGDLSQSMGSMIDSLGEMFDSSAQKTREAENATSRAGEALKKAEEATSRAEGARRDGMLAAASELEGSVEVITSASTQLAAQIELSERGSMEQASRITSTATAMEEMNSTVLEVAKNASDASDASTRTRQKAEAGAKVVQQAVHSIQEVHSQSAQLRTDMLKLDENARAISQIMGVISDIADQTNLLALNAAIEAARAGEAGRGFAVVADEVRKLAEKTMASTADVGNAIRAIQQSATQSMAQVDRAVKSIEEATEFANQSGSALEEIVIMVDNTADQVRSIATASEQQSATSEEINTSVAQVNTIAAETARAMQESASAVNDLAKQAQVLTTLIANMKR